MKVEWIKLLKNKVIKDPILKTIISCFYGEIAQLIERHPIKVKVRGLSPFLASMLNDMKISG